MKNAISSTIPTALSIDTNNNLNVVFKFNNTNNIGTYTFSSSSNFLNVSKYSFTIAALPDYINSTCSFDQMSPLDSGMVMNLSCILKDSFGNYAYTDTLSKNNLKYGCDDYDHSFK